ncbi:Paraquat-inducible protein B OS=Castellaniella defragrans OX=75697 GN=HNR28_000346 PE=4 SV=1 [Castellaniella defragrans]
MAEEGRQESPASQDDPAEPVLVPGRKFRWSWVWLVPLLALAVALSLLASVWVRTGPTITISFPTAAGLAVGQTKLRYRDVEVGVVKDIRVAEDRQQVLVDVQLKRDGAQYITQKGSKFWIVRPQVSLAGVSGLNTLISGEYLSVDAPTRVEGSAVYQFQGLENPPEVLNGQGDPFRAASR